MEYNFSKDLKSIREILGVSQSEFADQIGVEQVTISRNELALCVTFSRSKDRRPFQGIA